MNSSTLSRYLPPITKHLLIINVIMWIATMILKSRDIDLDQYLGLHYWRASDFNPAQFFTYMFMHDSSSIHNGFMHLFFNMFSLWMFGSVIERALSAKRYIFYYIACGIGAAIVQEIVWEVTWSGMFTSGLADGAGNLIPAAQAKQMLDAGQLNYLLDSFYNELITVGASGAVFGILLAFGYLFPNMRMYIIPFPFPIKAKWVVIGYGLIELTMGVTGRLDSIAHFAHLGGMIFGFIILLYWKKKRVIGNNGYM